MESITHLETFMKIIKLAHFQDQLVHQFLIFITMNLNKNPFSSLFFHGYSIFEHLQYHVLQYDSFLISDLDLLGEELVVYHVEYVVQLFLCCQYTVS